MKKFELILLLCLLLGKYSAAQTAVAINPNIHYITDTTLNFNQLISKFKGQPVFVDFWATWCGPCRWELQQKKDIKAFADFAAKNNIVILYICLDSDGTKWKPFIAQNKLVGYHMLGNPHIYKDVHTTFGVPKTRRSKIKDGFFIPRHLIVDATSAVVDSMADRQGSSKVYAEFRKMVQH